MASSGKREIENRNVGGMDRIVKEGRKKRIE